MPARYRKLITEAYSILGGLTPVRGDCGKLCGAACCQGDDYGMLLFPGEAAMLRGVAGFEVQRIPYMDGDAWLLLCGGSCDRDQRPLSCRVFPLAPKIGKDGSVSAVPDPRAGRMCPLSGERLDPKFRRAVGKVFDHLASEPKALELMRQISDEIQELDGFLDKLTSK